MEKFGGEAFKVTVLLYCIGRDWNFEDKFVLEILRPSENCLCCSDLKKIDCVSLYRGL